jgi:hypothetical protein
VPRPARARLDVVDRDSARLLGDDSEQAQSRLAWARTVPGTAEASVTRLSLGHA